TNAINTVRFAGSHDLQVRSLDGSESLGGMAPLTPKIESAVTGTSASGFTVTGTESGAKPVSNTVTVIDAGATLELANAYWGTISFAGSTGTLIIDHSSSFTGRVSGLAGTDALDLADVHFGANTQATFLGNTNGGTLTVTDGANTANIALVGNYLSSHWDLS